MLRDDMIEKRLFRSMTLIRPAVWRPIPDRCLRHIVLHSMECSLFSYCSLYVYDKRWMPVAASQCQSLPASAGHSHSIVNEPFFRFDINSLVIGICGNTMKNTMFRNSWFSPGMRVNLVSVITVLEFTMIHHPPLIDAVTARRARYD